MLLQLSGRLVNISNVGDDPSGSNRVNDQEQMNVDYEMVDSPSPRFPPILKHLTFGLNEVVKCLERHITRLRERVIGEEPLP